MITIKNVTSSVTLRPVTETYLAGVATIILTVNDFFSLIEGIVVFGFAALFILLCTMLQELTTVHELVDAQHDDLIKRVDTLLGSLYEQGIDSPLKDAYEEDRNV